MLLHYAGEEVFNLGESLGIVDETSFDDTKRVLTEYFAPQRNEEYEVFVFRQAEQLADETLDKFNARLSQIARHCNFHDVDREVRSQIIQKCQSRTVRDNGLSEPSISLADLVKNGRTLEAINAQGQAMVGNCGVAKSRKYTRYLSNSRHIHGMVIAKRDPTQVEIYAKIPKLITTIAVIVVGQY